MLRLLLDEHVPTRLADELPRHRRQLNAIALRDFDGGAHLGAPDDEVLRAAATRGFTLLTYDLRTVPSLLRVWAEAGIRHNGVIFVDEKTIAPEDIGGLVKSVCALFDAMGEVDWTDRIVHLTKTTT